MAGRLRDAILADTRANQPAATAVAVGTLYYVTDEGELERSNGTSWVQVGLSETGHDAHDHTGVPGVGGGGGAGLWTPWIGNIPPYAVNGDANLAATDRVLVVPFKVDTNVAITTAYFRVGTANGNMAIAVYDSALARLATTGSFAMPASGNQTAALSVSLTAGTLYYLAVGFSSATGSLQGYTSAAAVNTGQQFIRLAAVFPPADPIVITVEDGIQRIPGVWLAA